MRTAASGLLVAALVAGGAALIYGVGLATGESPSAVGADAGAGRALFQQSCATCHGDHAQGVPGVGPSLLNAGALAADFELSTGRMPLPFPTAQPVRAHPKLSREQIRSLVTYIGSLGGPPIPRVSTAGASVVTGRELYAANCASCHQITGSGGVVPGANVPALQSATPRQIAEAIRLGPYLMPRFSRGELSDRHVADIAAYVVSTRRPDDPGGWAIGHLGPVPEGMVAWGIGVVALLVIARLIGERTPA